MYGAFYTNICKVLSTLNGGIKHQRPTVSLPLSKVGLELSRILANLGIIDDFSIAQRMSRVRSHARMWDPTRTHISSSADAAGYPAMYLTLHINWDKHKPLWSRTPLAAAPHLAALGSAVDVNSSAAALAPPAQLFTPPMSLNSPTPESIKIISKPSLQRWVGLQQLLTARRTTPPGIFLLSTNQGLLTDIDCELRGIGGTLLAHLGLPLGHVIQLRGLLGAKYRAELAAALPPGTSLNHPTALQRAKLRAQHVPLAEWDGRAESARGLTGRLEAAAPQAEAYLNAVEWSGGQQQQQQGAGAPKPLWQAQARELLAAAERTLLDLQVQEEVMKQRGGDRGEAGAGAREDAEGGGRRTRRGGRGGGREGRRQLFAGGEQ